MRICPKIAERSNYQAEKIKKNKLANRLQTRFEHKKVIASDSLTLEDHKKHQKSKF